MSAKIRAKLEKESRWDAIRKKHIHCINVTSETVRKFLTMDFVDEERIFSSGKTRRRLDPVIVMNLRHEMIQRKPKPKEDKSNIPGDSGHPSEAAKPSELSMIERELEKFKSEINRMKVTPRVNPQKNPKNMKKKKKSILIKLNNSGIFESLIDVGEKTKDFYETAINAAEATLSEEEEATKSIDDEKPIEKQEDLPLATNSVRFMDNIEVITYSRETSIMTGLDDSQGVQEEEEEDDIGSLIEDEAAFFGLNKFNEDDQDENHQLNYSEKTFTTTTTTVQQLQFRYLSKEHFLSPSTSSTDEAESTESSELNFYSQMLNFDDQDVIPEEPLETDQLNDLGQTMTIKSFKNLFTEEEIVEETANNEEDLVKEIIRVKAVANVENRHRILRKYLMKWMHYTTIQRITKDSNLTTKSQRMTKIDAYLRKIREQKKIAHQENKSNPDGKGKMPRDNAIVMVKRYQSKLKIQQDIIEVQKMKLERQERMIAELRLSRLSDDAAKFKQDLREELRNAMRTGDVRLRAKAKCLQVVGDVVDEEPENKFVAYGNMIPKFLAKMQERAAERQMKHEQAKERRLQLDQEKDALKQAYEDDKRKADEEAKKQRMLELQEKRRKEKLEKIRKEQEREKWIENNRKATAFYRRYLLRRFGLDRLKKLVNRKRTLELQVTNLRKRIKVKNCFKAWWTYSRWVWTQKYEKAQEYYELYITRNCMRVWRSNLLIARGQMLVAIDWYEMKLNEKYFATWLAYTREAKIQEETKMRHAETHYKWHIMWKMLEHWQRLHSVLKLERETEERRQRWRHKIWELLPDYTPALDN